MEESTAPTQRAGSLAVWFVALVVHAASLLGIWGFIQTGRPDYGLFGAVLLVVSALIFLLPRLFARQWFERRSAVLGLTAALTLCLPGLGILGSMLASLCAQLLMRQKNKTMEFKKSLEMALGDDSRWITRKRVGQVLADEIAIEPVIDVLQGEDPDLKRGAVKLLQRIATPGAVALLRQSLSDPFPEVRFYAHSALTEIEDGFTKRIQDINKSLEKQPTANAYRLLGQQYRAYADSGLADDIARKQHLETCAQALVKSLELEPDHAATMLLLAQALLDLNQLREAGIMFDKCLRHEQTSSEAQLGLAQIAYQKRDFGQLAVQARNMANSDAPRPEKADPLSLFEFWSTVGGARHG